MGSCLFMSASEEQIGAEAKLHPPAWGGDFLS